ncbi:hypothetical protein SLS62_002982 [Diatrype stigma]|uniref:Uncharacterized protein n=1 Tax=Diatrype stigma TaxID=117547 RepID=A0AAN9UXU2_9PEZI
MPCNLLMMIRTTRRATPSVFLVEDIHLGLCGMFQDVWRYTESRRTGVPSSPPSNQGSDYDGHDAMETLSARLDAWKAELDRTSALCRHQSVQRDDSVEFPLQAYRGFEDQELGQAQGRSGPGSGWRSMALNRVKALVQEATTLYHLLSLQLYTDGNMAVDGSGTSLGRCTSGAEESSTTRSSAENGEWTARWVRSKAARKPMSHAVALSKTTRAAAVGNGRARGSRIRALDPLAPLAVTVSSSVMRVWRAAAVDSKCTFGAVVGTQRTELGLDHNGLYRGRELEAWFQTGGVAMVDGVPVCQCAAESD